MSNELQKHKSADKAKWIVIFLLFFGLLACIVALFVMLDRQTTMTTIGGEAYEIGLLNEEGKEQEGETSIRMRKGVTVEGLQCAPKEGAKIKYRLFFYDKDGKFISASEEMTAEYEGTVPETAKTVKVMITPTADEDGKVSFVEVLGYANQLSVTVNKK